MATKCSHKNLFHGRFWKEEPNVGEKTQFVIQTVCADCGLILKTVDMVSPHPNK